MNRFQITAEIATTVWLGTAENYKYKPNRVHFRDIYIWKTSYTQDVEATSDGIATIYMNSNVWFDGDNPSLPRDKIVAEIKQRIDNRHGGNLAAIADALIAVFVDVYID